MIRPVRFGSVRFQASRFRFFRFRLILVNTRFRVLNTFLKNQKSPFPRRSLEIRISRVLLKVCRWSPRGGGGFAPPLGDPCILSQPRNSNFEWSSWKGTFLIFQKCVQNPKSCIYSHYGNSMNYVFFESSAKSLQNVQKINWKSKENQLKPKKTNGF